MAEIDQQLADDPANGKEVTKTEPLDKSTSKDDEKNDKSKSSSSKKKKKLKDIRKGRTIGGGRPEEVVINPPVESERQGNAMREEKESHVVFTFGRMNPPTTGHHKLIKKVESIAKQHNAKGHIILSHTEGKSKDPLPQSKKIQYAKKLTHLNVSGSDKTHPSFLHQAKKLSDAGHTHLHMVAGSDRVAEYKKLLHKYNGHPDHHNFKSITVHSAGSRDPDAEGVSGISGTKMRHFARKGDHNNFKKGLPTELHAHAHEIMRHIKSIKEEDDMDINDKFINILLERKLSPAELRKREKVAKAIGRENPDMPMDQKMAIATATAKKAVSEAQKPYVSSDSDGKHVMNSAGKIHKSFKTMDQANDYLKKNYKKLSEVTVNTADIQKKKMISRDDKDKLLKMRAMLDKEKKPAKPMTEEEMQEALTLQQRRKRALITRRLQPRLKRARMIAKRRMASPEKLNRRARRMAKDLLRKRFAGTRGAKYHELGPSDRVSVDKLIEPKVKLITKIAKRLFPRVKKAEMMRLQAARGGPTAQSKTPMGLGMSFEFDEKDFDRLYENIQSKDINSLFDIFTEHMLTHGNQQVAFDAINSLAATDIEDIMNEDASTSAKKQAAVHRAKGNHDLAGLYMRLAQAHNRGDATSVNAIKRSIGQHKADQSQDVKDAREEVEVKEYLSFSRPGTFADKAKYDKEQAEKMKKAKEAQAKSQKKPVAESGLSSDTLRSYLHKASDARGHRKLPTKKVDNRYAGAKKASDELEKRNNISEAPGDGVKKTRGRRLGTAISGDQKRFMQIMNRMKTPEDLSKLTLKDQKFLATMYTKLQDIIVTDPVLLHKVTKRMED